MDSDKIIDFYENLDKMESFARIKTIYELTNNLDPFLLRFLRKRFFYYHTSKLRNAFISNKKDDELKIELLFYEILHSNNISFEFSDYDENFKSLFDNPQLINDFVYKSDILLTELNELERIAIEKIERGNILNKTKPSELEEELIEEYNIPIIKRIIYLQKLGIIDFLRKEKPFNTSINSLANILSGIIDAKTTTIQPLLNMMLSNDIDNPKNPLNSKKNITTVENYLIKIGYQLK